ncbi:MAG: Gfo/Idh/MocA family protein, partial [Planctomycetota bacterium]
MLKVALIGSAGHQGYAVLGCDGNSDASIAAFATVDKEYDNFDGMINHWYTDKGIEAPPVYDDYKKMLDEVKPDVVSVSPAYFRHAEVAIECLERGIHTFCEKPVAFDLETLKKIKALKEEKGVEFTAMHEMRYHPHFQAAYKALKEGRIGRPIQITGQKSYAFSDSRPQFYKKRETYGSTLCWVAIHAIDWTYWFMGDIQNIYAAHTTIGNMNYG